MYNTFPLISSMVQSYKYTFYFMTTKGRAVIYPIHFLRTLVPSHCQHRLYQHSRFLVVLLFSFQIYFIRSSPNSWFNPQHDIVFSLFKHLFILTMHNSSVEYISFNTSCAMSVVFVEIRKQVGYNATLAEFSYYISKRNICEP